MLHACVGLQTASAYVLAELVGRVPSVHWLSSVAKPPSGQWLSFMTDRHVLIYRLAIANRLSISVYLARVHGCMQIRVLLNSFTCKFANFILGMYLDVYRQMYEVLVAQAPSQPQVSPSRRQ